MGLLVTTVHNNNKNPLDMGLGKSFGCSGKEKNPTPAGNQTLVIQPRA
jgi:hypothetical protein